MIQYVKILLVLVLISPVTVIASTIDYSWSFVEQNVLANQNEMLDIYITVKNEFSSVDSIVLQEMRFILSDDTFGDIDGVFVNESNGLPQYTPVLWQPPDTILNPGEEETFWAFSLVAGPGLEIGDQIFVNPLYYLDDELPGQYADAGLSITVVPLPASMLFLASGLFGLFSWCFYKKDNKQGLIPYH